MSGDVGYVVITEREDDRYRIEICGEANSNDRGVRPYAVHSGVSDYVIDSAEAFDDDGKVVYSRVPVRVYVSRDDERLHMADLTRVPPVPG